MANTQVNVEIKTKADLKAIEQFQSAFKRAFKADISAPMAGQLLKIGKSIQKLGGYTSPIQALKKGLDLSSVLTKSSRAMAVMVRTLGPALGKDYKFVRTEAELLRRAAQATTVKGLVGDLNKAANALKPIRLSLVKTDEGFRAIYVRTQLIRERLITHRAEVTKLRDKVASLRKEYDASAETAKTKNELKRLADITAKLQKAETELKSKSTKYQKDLNAATKEQAMLLSQTNAKLNGQKINIQLAAQEEKKLSDTAKIVLSTAKQQQIAAERLTKEKREQSAIDKARRESYALTIAGNQLKAYGQQWATVGRQASEAFADIDFQVRRAAAASGVSFIETGAGLETMLRPTADVNAQLNLMTSTAKRAAEAIGFIPTEEVARGMYFFASTTGQGFNTVNELNYSMSQLTPIMQAASITSTDLETTIKGVYGILNQFSLGTEKAASVTEMLYFAAQKTAAEFPDFVESMKMLGPVAAQAGVSFEDTIKSLGVLADSGIRGSTAGRALRQMFLQLNDPADRSTQILDKAATKLKGTGTVFKDLVYDAKGNFLGMANYIRVMAEVTDQLTQRESSRLLGMIATAAETPALTKLIEAESEAMRDNKSIITDNTKEIGNAQKARELFAKSVELVTASTKASLGRIDTSIKNIKATFGAALAPAIEKLSYVLADIAERFDEFAAANPKLMETVALLAMMASVGAIVGGTLLGIVGIFVMMTRAIAPILRQMGILKGAAALVDDTLVVTGTNAAKTAKSVSGISKAASFLSGIFGGLKSKAASPFTAIKAGGGIGAKVLGVLGKVGGFVGGIFRVLSLKVQAVITVFAGLFTGLFQGLNAGKGETDALGGAMSVVGTILEGVGKVVEIVTAAFGFLFEAARSVGIILGQLFGEGGFLKPLADIVGTLFGALGNVLGFFGDVVSNATTALKQMNDDALNPQGKRIREIDAEVARLKAGYSTMSLSAITETEKRIALLEKEKNKIISLTNATTNAFVNSQAFIDFRAGERSTLTEGWTNGIIAQIKEKKQGTGTLDGDSGTSTAKTAQEKALELAQQAASLAEALYKIDGLDLKSLVKRTMGKVAEAMKLAIKYSLPYAKAFSEKTLTVVGNFADAVGKVASAIGGMVDAAEKIATYKAPNPAALKQVVADISVAMKYMIAEGKKFSGSSVIQVQAFADSAQAVVGSIGAAVEAFNSMATGVYSPPGDILKKVADDISKAVAAFVAQLATAPTQPMLDKAQAFATAADATLGTIGNAVNAFKDLRKFVRPLPEDLQAVVDTIEIAIRKMIVSMGNFSLTKDQLDVVNTFAGVANAIAGAVGATYDAFVKQMDFVDQFRTEIDYEKVFGWIEMGIRKMADIAGAMPVGMIAMANDAAEAATAIAGALEAFFNLAVNTGGDPALLADSLQGAVNTVLAVIEAFASTTQFVGAQFVDSLIVGMQSRESALAAEAARLTQIMSGVGATSSMRNNNNTMTINHVVTDPNGVLKNATAQEVANLLSGDVFISNLQHSIKTQ
jgi:TP901 family phage tail tape measure protein